MVFTPSCVCVLGRSPHVRPQLLTVHRVGLVGKGQGLGKGGGVRIRACGIVFGSINWIVVEPSPTYPAILRSETHLPWYRTLLQPVLLSYLPLPVDPTRTLPFDVRR